MANNIHTRLQCRPPLQAEPAATSVWRCEGGSPTPTADSTATSYLWTWVRILKSVAYSRLQQLHRQHRRRRWQHQEEGAGEAPVGAGAPPRSDGSYCSVCSR